MIPNWHLTLFIKIYIYIYIYLYDEKHFRVAKAWVDDSGFLELLKMVSDRCSGSAVCAVREATPSAASSARRARGLLPVGFFLLTLKDKI